MFKYLYNSLHLFPFDETSEFKKNSIACLRETQYLIPKRKLFLLLNNIRDCIEVKWNKKMNLIFPRYLKKIF